MEVKVPAPINNAHASANKREEEGTHTHSEPARQSAAYIVLQLLVPANVHFLSQKLAHIDAAPVFGSATGSHPFERAGFSGVAGP